MVDLAIGGALASLKTAGEIAGSFLKVRDIALVQGKVIELQSVILAAQQSAMTAQGEQLALLNDKRDLEQHVAELEKWEGEKARYKLSEVGPGNFAYTLKFDADTADPFHMLCASCYNQGRKEIIQRRPRVVVSYWAYVCARCKSETITMSAQLKALGAPDH